jgi:hypothetical protein
LLTATVALPAVAFAWGSLDGRLAFVLYREPKLIALAITGWSLLAAWTWIHRANLTGVELRELFRLSPVAALGVLLSYLTLTGLWVSVRQNYFYEINQLVLLFLLLLMLLAWSRRDSTVTGRVLGTLIISLGVVTLVGLVQMLVTIPWLQPIELDIEVANPSLFGYKNPAALALLGQIFLLTELVFANRHSIPRRLRPLLGGLLLLELFYLATLRSRTAYAALIAGILFLALLLSWRLRSQRQGIDRRSVMRGVVVVLAIVVVLAGTLALSPPVRTRVTSLLSFFAEPSEYLRSDRWTYLVNTVNMARHHPFGVGLGDWQSQYPVYRLYQREVAFDDAHQVRRAHSDHVQILGEGGWPALILWLLFLTLLIGGTARRYLQSGRRELLFRSTQLLTIAAAMASDYLIEMPYHKAQLFLVVFLALAAWQPTDETWRQARGGAARLLLAALLCLAALAQTAYHCALAGKIHTAATIERCYLEAQANPARRTGLLRRALVHGERFASLPGHTKTFYKHWLILAQSAHYLGDRNAARTTARASLVLHPHYPAAFLLMSRIETDPDTARLWREGYEHIMAEATHGFERQLP